jgi:hypothetical protein
MHTDLAARPHLDEQNFWRPGGSKTFKAPRAEAGAGAGMHPIR